MSDETKDHGAEAPPPQVIEQQSLVAALEQRLREREAVAADMHRQVLLLEKQLERAQLERARAEGEAGEARYWLTLVAGARPAAANAEGDTPS